MDKANNSKDQVLDPTHKINGQIVMPSKSNVIDQRDYDQHLYKARYLIEVLLRDDKLAHNFLSEIHPASIMIWLN